MCVCVRVCSLIVSSIARLIVPLQLLFFFFCSTFVMLSFEIMFEVACRLVAAFLCRNSYDLFLNQINSSHQNTR